MVTMTDTTLAARLEAERAIDTPPPLARSLDPVDLLDELVRETRAARTLIVLATPGDERRRAAVDALNLCADVLEDARAAWLAAP
jgi:hypothetical protein